MHKRCLFHGYARRLSSNNHGAAALLRTQGYCSMLKAKTDGVYEKIDKLGTGLSKLVEARQQVETMNEELEVKKEDVAKKQRECDELMVVIAEKRMLADDQMKQVQIFQDVLGVRPDWSATY